MLIQKQKKQIISTGNLTIGDNDFFHYWRSKGNILDFSKGTAKVLWFYFILIGY